MSDTRSRDAGPEFWSAEEVLRARVRQREATGTLGLAALTETDLSGLMEETVHAVAGVLGVEYCKVLELIPDGTTLLLRAGVGWREGLVGTTTVGTNLRSQAGYALISPQQTSAPDNPAPDGRPPAALLGHSTREIGRKLYVSEATVRNHIRGLLQAFGAHSQLEVLARAREAGVL